MKRSLFVVVGLALALSVGAQTTEEEKKPEKKRKARTEETQAAPQKAAQPNMKAKAHAQTQPAERRTSVQSHERANEKARSSQHSVAKNEQKGGSVTRSSTVFRNGHKTSENLSVRRSTREVTDLHFKIGTHPRAWWLRSYTVVLLDGCYYYLADNGFWYPAYGFEPGCTFPVGVVYISL